MAARTDTPELTPETAPMSPKEAALMDPFYYTDLLRNGTLDDDDRRQG
jgi:hypothetical protein